MAADPRAAAGSEVGLIVAGVAGLLTDIPRTVCESTADFANKMLEQAGSKGSVVCERIDLADPSDWQKVAVGQEPAPAGLAPGRHWVVRIRIDNPVELARKERGAVAIGLARLFGMNIPGRVNHTVAQVAAEAYHSRKLDMLVKFTDRE
jgi:hypothetical protein